MNEGVPDNAPLTASVDWEDRNGGAAKRSLLGLEGLTLRAERPVAAAVRRPEFNPLYHTGPITVFLFVVVFATGLYLTMFYRFGFEASYEAVSDLEGNFVGRFVRAAHRYGSIAMIVTAVLHGWRTFVMDRFRGPRRMAWLTGVAMVIVLWLIGVTGYWLIWDERAQVLNDALTRLVAGFPAGLDFLLDNVLTDAAGTGWPFLLLVFAVHLFLSIGVAVLIWVHGKRLARPQWLPPPFWTAVVGGSLLVMSVLWPLGMLPALDRSLLPGPIPIDPFFLFMLPGSVTWPPGWLWGGATVVGIAVMFLPWLFRRRRAAPLVIDAAVCTGCTLCVPDCPYDALRMVDRDDGSHPHLAVLDPTACVACGICVGSCPVEAIAFSGKPASALWVEVAEAAQTADKIVFSCERHAAHGGAADPGAITFALPCVGMAHPDLIGSATDGGAAVHVVGCPPGDCANREGNLILAERMGRWRRPRLKRRYRKADITTDWIAPDRLTRALEQPGAADSSATAPPLVASTLRNAAPLLALVTITAVITVWVTGFRFDPDGGDVAFLTLALDHRAGVPLVGFEGEPAPTGAAPRLTVALDGTTVFDETFELVDADDPNTALAWERIELNPGTYSLRVDLYDTSEPIVLFDDTIAVAAGEAFVLDYRDVPVVVAADAGRDLYFRTALGPTAGCRICHSIDEGETLVGPSLAGIATRAATTVPGLSAEGYIRESILDPDAFVVDGFRAGQMLPGLDEILTEDEIDNLVAFLLTLEEVAP